VRIAALVALWLAVAILVASTLGLYDEALAAWVTVPALGLILAYCASHRSRATATLAVMAILATVLIIGFAIVIPKGSAA
jgi:hypothetical protein